MNVSLLQFLVRQEKILIIGSETRQKLINSKMRLKILILD